MSAPTRRNESREGTLRFKILVIEDDEAIRALLRQLLTGEGYDVATAPDGKVALEILGSQVIHLVITDILMPEKEGIETIFRLRRNHRDVKVIAISGGGRFGPETYLELAKKIGADRTFSKPFETKKMLEAVRELLEPPA